MAPCMCMCMCMCMCVLIDWCSPLCPCPCQCPCACVCACTRACVCPSVRMHMCVRVGVHVRVPFLCAYAVALDRCSLYQAKPVPRTEAQEASFHRALANMSMWYAMHMSMHHLSRCTCTCPCGMRHRVAPACASTPWACTCTCPPRGRRYGHKLTTVYILQGQPVEVARAERGWPFYEEIISSLLKDAPRGTSYVLRKRAPSAPSAQPVLSAAARRRLGCFWSKVEVIDSLAQARPIPPQVTNRSLPPPPATGPGACICTGPGTCACICTGSATGTGACICIGTGTGTGTCACTCAG